MMRSYCNLLPRHSADVLRNKAILLGVSLLASQLLACSGGKVDDTTGPIVPPVDTTDNAPVQRATLTVSVAFDPLDAPLTTAAGVTLAGLSVRVVRPGSSDPVRTAQTDATGNAQFTQLLQGVYTISIDRPLTAAEQQQLPHEDRDVSVLAAGAQISVAPPARHAHLELVAARRGSVVFSEFYGHIARVANSAYPYAHYFEVYNNSDTTVYLDGMMIARRPSIGQGLQWPADPCETTNLSTRLDPDGIWVFEIYAFPGSGLSHPLAPGQTAVIAVDAIDHGNAGLPDLSKAQFEIYGTDADVDNPAAANMVRIRALSTVNFGHGQSMKIGSLYTLALPFARDTSEMLEATIFDRDVPTKVFRIPREAILDAVGIDMPVENELASESYQQGLRGCEPWAAPHFERSRMRLMTYASVLAVRRKSLGRTASGQEILQRTGTGARDFEHALPLRRSLNK